MPSHKVHRILASKYLKIPEAIANRVDKIIDLGPLHDVGRRVPRPIPKYLEIFEFGSIERLLKLEKHRKCYEVLKDVLSNEIYTKAFFFHHALDLLSFRIASALILNTKLSTTCNDLVKGTLEDLKSIKYNIRMMGFDVVLKLNDIEAELERALNSCCLDHTLITWIDSKLINELRKYQSLDFIKTKYIEKVKSITKTNTKYGLGLMLGTIALIYRNRDEISKSMERISFLLGVKGHDTDLSMAKTNYEEQQRLLDLGRECKGSSQSLYRREQNLRNLTPYGLGILRKTAFRLAALYSRFFYIPFLQPVPLSLAFEKMLSVGKRKYSTAKDILDCYRIHRDSHQRIAECVDHVFNTEVRPYTKVDLRELEDIKNKLVEALHELISLSLNMGINLLENT